MTPDQYPYLISGMIALGLITFSYRYSFISTWGRKVGAKIPTNLLALLGPAVFTVIITNNILSYQNQPTEFQNKIVVAGLALVVAYFTKSVIGTVLFGLVLLHFLSN